LNKFKLIFGTFLLLFFSASFSANERTYLEGSYLNSEWDNTSIPIEDSTVTIGYNILNGVEKAEYYDIDSELPFFQPFVPPALEDYKQDEFSLNVNPVISYVFPPDDRVKITSTSSFPWSSICKIYITAADNSRWVGSGAMIDAYHVLTAAHLVYLHENGGWASRVEVIPGMRRNSEPFGSAYATHMRAYSGWIQDEMEEHDWAVLTLDRTIGNKTGWMGRMTANPTDPIYLGTLHTAGYPGDLDFGENMYYVSDIGADVDQFNHWYWMDSAGGQSGSPVWAEINGSGYILSVHAYEYLGGTYANFGTRLNQDKYDQINAWLAADNPPVYNPGLDPIIIIVIVLITAISIIAVAIVISRKYRRSSPKSKNYQEFFTSYNSKSSESLRTQKLNAQPFSYCPRCGRGIFRDTQRFCSYCGTTILNLDSEE
jgi:V8-like Glu-specific endopeptidase